MKKFDRICFTIVGIVIAAMIFITFGSAILIGIESQIVNKNKIITNNSN